MLTNFDSAYAQLMVTGTINAKIDMQCQSEQPMSSAFLTTPLVGRRYQPIRELGAGGMGRVYETLDRITGQRVALKHMLAAPDQLQFASRLSITSNSRLALAHEFHTLASLHHPHIINVIDYGFDTEQHPYFTMSLLDKSQTIVAAGTEQSLEERIHLLLQMVEALVYIHRRHILHRDLKPSNVLVQDGHVYVLDFGLAVDVEYSHDGHVSGTLAYIAPEVLRGEAAREASDLYTVGLLAYQMIAGKLPYPVDDAQEMMHGILYNPLDLGSLGISPDLALVLGRLLAKQPEDRYQSAEEVIHALYGVTGQPVPQEAVEIRESFLQAARFVGRESEMKTLVGALSATLNGTGGSWLIGGESGVGKSRLIDEIRIRALVEGILVLRGQAVAEASSPYHLWRDVMRRLLLHNDPAEDDLPLLKVIVPDVETLLNREVSSLAHVDADIFMQHLAIAVEQCFRRVLTEQPIMLILEDLQWAHSSLWLLSHLNQLTSDLPFIIIGTYRDDEYPGLSDELTQMNVIPLKRLDDKEIARLSAAMLGKAGERPQVVNFLQRETEGNVFFLIEVVRALSEESGRMSDIGLSTLPDRVFAGGMRRILERRIEHLPEWAQPALYIAAVMGRQIDILLLQAAEPQMDIEQWLTVCANAAVLDTQDGYWRFAHDKLREYILDQLSPATSANLHLRAAETIEQVYSANLDDYAVVLAEHWAAAGDEIKEGHYSRIAAQQLFEASDFHSAKRLNQRALELNAHEHTEKSWLVLAELHHQMGRACYGLGEFQEAGEWQRSALDLFRDIGDQGGVALAISSLGELNFRQGKYQQAKPQTEQALEMFRELDDRKQVGYSLMNLGVIAASDGDLLEAKGLFEECLACMQEVGEPISIARALNNVGITHDLLGDLPRAKMLHTQALAIRRRINDRQGIAYSLNNLATLAEIEGNYANAQRWGLESLAILHGIGAKMSIASAYGLLGKVALKTKDYAAAENYYQDSLVLRRELGDVDGTSHSLCELGEVAREQGDFETAWGYFQQSLQGAMDAALEKRAVGTLIQIARLKLQEEEPEQALELLLFAHRFNQRLHIPTDDFDPLIAELRVLLPAEITDEIEARGETATLDSIVSKLLDRV